MKPSANTDVPRWLAIAGVVATIITMCIAAIALIPDFGDWLAPRVPKDSFTSAPTATEIADAGAPTSTSTSPQPTSTPTPTSFASDTAPPAANDTPPPTPTHTPQPTSRSEPTVPSGYQIFDGFDGEGTPDGRWFPDGDLDACSFEQQDGRLRIRCQGNTREDVEWYYNARADNIRVVGRVAMAAQVNNPKYVNEHWGAIYLMVHFFGGDETTSIRTYHISLRGATAYVIEMYPEEQWRQVVLAEITFSEPQMHVVRIEFESEEIRFFIDGEPIGLRRQPNIPADSTRQEWVFGGSVFKDQEAATQELDALVYWIAVKE